MKKIVDETWQSFELGMFSANVGPHTEYHFLPEAAPRHGWSVACFGTRPAGSEWRVSEIEGRRAMEQTFTNERRHTHPMVSTGHFLWGDYVARTTFRPLSPAGRCGLVVLDTHDSWSYSVSHYSDTKKSMDDPSASVMMALFHLGRRPVLRPTRLIFPRIICV